jgi:regulator of sigma E protease
MLDAVLYVAPYLLVLTVVVTVHELGHFLVARAFGMAVDVFSIGFGPTLLSWRDRAGVEWRVAAVPLGGYVKFAGDADPSSSVPDGATVDALRREVRAREGAAGERRYFHLRPVGERAAVAAAGPVANFLFSVVLFAALLFAMGDLKTTPRVRGVLPDSPAERAGFQVGDLVTSVDGRPVDDFDRIVLFVQGHAGDPVRFGVLRGAPGAQRRLELTATPVRKGYRDPLTGQTLQVGAVGLYNPHAAADQVRVRYTPAQAVAAGAGRVGEIVGSTLGYMGRLVRGLENGDQLGGPIRMAQASHAIAAEAMHGRTSVGARVGAGAVALLSVAAVISVAIGFMNLLPIPVLDGGHLVFYAYEALARRPAAASVQAAGMRLGLVLVLALMLFATWNDLRQPLLRMLGGALS